MWIVFRENTRRGAPGTQPGGPAPHPTPRTPHPAARSEDTSPPCAGGAGRAVGRPPPGCAALRPEVAGDVVLHVGHGRRLDRRPGHATRRAGCRRRRRWSRVRSWPAPHRGCRCGRRAARRRGPGPPRRGRRRAGGSGRGARRSIRAARRSPNSALSRAATKAWCIPSTVNVATASVSCAPGPDRGPSTRTPSMARSPSYSRPASARLVGRDGVPADPSELVHGRPEGHRADDVGRAGLLALGRIGPDHLVEVDQVDGAAAGQEGIAVLEDPARPDRARRRRRVRTACGR